ncbi:MAG: methyltransferase domain-containing protein, partial [Candidatus Altiarchaeota archaeon]|nr:methyltransferase domain-containing protein [Candidatus Altiarchaeota archaeon]
VFLDDAFRKGEKFDVIVSHRALLYFKNPAAAIVRAEQVLAPGGWSSIQVRSDKTRELLGEDARSFAEGLQRSGYQTKTFSSYVMCDRSGNPIKGIDERKDTPGQREL